MKKLILLLFILCVVTTSHSQSAAQDFHSHSNPQDVRVRHLDLDWDVSFDKKTLTGAAVLTIDRLNKQAPLVLDTRHLNIDKVETSANGSNYAATKFSVGQADPILGAPLTIQLPADAKSFALIILRTPTRRGCNGLRHRKQPASRTLSCSRSRRQFMRAAGFRSRTRRRFA